MKLSRRMVARAVFGAPLVLAAASAARLESLFGIAAARAAGQAEPQPSPAPEPEEPPLARFLARQEEGLSAAERRRVRREVTQMEQALKEVRDFKIGNDVPPSGTFRALRTRRTDAR
ncbi:MAG: hypothetical protein AAB249_03455 [Acidobacteriota bacterium]